MAKKSFLSIKTKLILLIALIVTAISLFVYIYFPYDFERQQIKTIESRVVSLAQIASYSVATAIYFNDNEATSDQITALIISEDIDYVVISTPQDSTYYNFNLPQAINNSYLNTSSEFISKDKSVFRTSKKIELNKEIIGTLYLGYSLRQLNYDLDKLKTQIAFVSILIFLFGLIATYYIGDYITKPLLIMVETVEQIRGGDLTKRAEVLNNDEIGYLSNSFNSMVERIETTNEELEFINEELELRVLERTEDLTKSEARFRSLYENSTIGIYRTSLNGKILMANPALIKMLGFRSLEELQNREHVLEGYENKNAHKKFISIIEKDGVVKGLEQKWKKTDGSIIHIRESAHALKDENGETLYYDGTVEDITAKKNIEAELIRSKDKAESAVKMKTEFLAQMSHEIRTPINSILSYTQLLKDELIESVPEELQFSFDMINNGGQRLIRTVDLILNMSELQTGTYEVIIEKCNVVEILNQLVGEFKTAANSKKLDLMLINRLEETDLTFEADIYTLTQIFANLLDNAIKYTNEGSIEVVVYKSNNNLVSVDVQDTGIGISKKFQEALFEPFTQEEQGYTRKFDGNGLGMALVKEYCRLNDSTISVRSKKDEGSTFTVNIHELRFESSHAAVEV